MHDTCNTAIATAHKLADSIIKMRSQPISDRILLCQTSILFDNLWEIENEYYDQEAATEASLIDTGSYTADYFDSKYISAQTRTLIERDQKRNEELKPQDAPELLAFQAKYPPGTMFYDEDTEEVLKLTK